jgi:hypothetical protein
MQMAVEVAYSSVKERGDEKAKMCHVREKVVTIPPPTAIKSVLFSDESCQTLVWASILNVDRRLQGFVSAVKVNVLAPRSRGGEVVRNVLRGGAVLEPVVLVLVA